MAGTNKDILAHFQHITPVLTKDWFSVKLRVQKGEVFKMNIWKIGLSNNHKYNYIVTSI